MAPSIFLSYASEDRAAARRLRDALAAAGLEVWYDEDELAGGDAWDQKIRRQIRECTYFMPLISAATENRREGYFRREWRLATERTLDMADDVMFLLPVGIDQTPDVGARVPDRFLAVQWLRCPEGEPTSAFTALAQRLLAGESVPPPLSRAGSETRASARARSRGRTPKTTTSEEKGPPPMPAFPQPQPDHRLKYLAEVLWWVITAAYAIFRRLPRWIRIIIMIWIGLTLLRALDGSDDPADSRRSRQDAELPAATAPAEPDLSSDGPVQIDSETRQQLEAVATELERKSAADPDSVAGRFANVSSQFVRKLANASAPAAGRRLVIPPFANLTADPAAAAAVGPVFNALFGRLAVAFGNDVGVLAGAESNAVDTAIAEAARAGDRFIMLGEGTRDDAGNVTLHVRVVAVADKNEVWRARYALAEESAEAVAQQIAESLPPNIPD